MIYFECYSDQAFLHSLGVTSKNMDHSFSKGNVCNKLQRSTNSIGLVDEDPGETQPSFIRYLIEAQRIVYNDQYLILFSDPKTQNRLILIRPNIEAWSIRIAKDLEIDLSSSSFNLSSNEDELHELLGFARNHRMLESFKNFFIGASKHPAIIRIKDFIQ